MFVVWMVKCYIFFYYLVLLLHVFFFSFDKKDARFEGLFAHVWIDTYLEVLVVLLVFFTFKE